MAKLKPQHRKFVDELLRNPQSATAAAIAAGYSENAAAQTAYDLQQRPDVAAELERRSTKALVLADADVERIVKELAALGFSDLTTILNAEGGLLPVSQWPKEITVCIASMEFEDTIRMETGPDGEAVERHVQFVSKIRLWSKTQALALLAQYRKMIGGDGGNLPGAGQVFVGMQVVVAPGATLNVQQQVNEKGTKDG